MKIDIEKLIKDIQIKIDLLQKEIDIKHQSITSLYLIKTELEEIINKKEK